MRGKCGKSNTIATTYHCAVARERTKRGDVASGQGADKSADENAHDAILEAESIRQGAEHANAQVVGRQVGAEPEKEDLQVMAAGALVTLLWRDAADAADFEARESF